MTSTSGNFAHRLNISAVSQSNRGDKVREWFKSNVNTPPGSKTENTSFENDLSQPSTIEDKVGAYGDK